MKLKTIFTIMILSIFSHVYASNPKVDLITQVYQDFYEKKDITHMDKFFSPKLSFQVNANPPTDYDALKEHLIQVNQECIQLKMLPFEKVLVVGNEVVTLYTQNCTDKFNHIQKKRIMAITEFDENNQIAKIAAVTNSINR